MNKSDMHMYSHTLLRVVIGLLFVIQGYRKFTNPDGVVAMLTGIGFPLATFFAWILLLSELVFGALILVGFKIKYTAWPLAFILLVAELTVVMPGQGILSVNSFFHVISIAALVVLATAGQTKWAISKN